MMAAVIQGVGKDDNADIDGIRVEGSYRRQGIGTYLMGKIERGAKEFIPSCPIAVTGNPASSYGTIPLPQQVLILADGLIKTEITKEQTL